MTRHRITIALLLLCCAVLTPLDAAAQPASFTTYGSSCSAGATAPAIGHRGLPQLGTTFSITYSGPNVQYNSAQQIVRPWLLFGLGPAQQPIPPVFRQQPPGCTLWTTGDIAVPMPPERSAPTWQSSFDLAVPADTRLLGAVLYAQWLAVLEQCGVVRCDIEWVLGSDAARIVLGT